MQESLILRNLQHDMRRSHSYHKMTPPSSTSVVLSSYSIFTFKKLAQQIRRILQSYASAWPPLWFIGRPQCLSIHVHLSPSHHIRAYCVILLPNKHSSFVGRQDTILLNGATQVLATQPEKPPEKIPKAPSLHFVIWRTCGSRLRHWGFNNQLGVSLRGSHANQGITL